ncbi:MAG: HlyC/CorC family transporter [Saprospiraceae bacterium]|nr:HlyC/CorC family transporter [Saprospiraceae bacterium]
MEILIILLFNLVNAVFALSEIALVSVKRQRMVQLAENGNAKAKTVLELLKNPEGFLSAVQIGITLIGIVSGVYGGATLTDNFRPVVEQVEVLRPYAHTIAYVLVVGLITYLSIVIGELIPKTLAMKFAEPVALGIGGFIKLFSRIASPFVWLLTSSTYLVFKVFGVKPAEEEKITDEELRYFIKTAGRQGLLDKDESEIHDNVLSFSDLRAKSLMTHRLEVEWVDVTESIGDIENMLRESHHSHFPACEKTYDKVLGFLDAKDFFARKDEPNFQLRSILREPVFIPETQYAIDVLQHFKKRRCYFGIVIDEFGAFEGVLTLHDISEALVGDLPDNDDESSGILRRDDGSLLVSGHVLVADLNHFLKADFFPVNNPFYSTIAGFILHKLEYLPKVGEKFEYHERHFEILDMDGAKIDKVLVK